MDKQRTRGVNSPPFVDLHRAAELMLDGHAVIFPTETFFGLGSRALDADATARVFRAKHRSTVRPLPLILGEWDQLDLVAKVPDAILPLLHQFWPGPLSVIFPARLRVPDILTGGTGRVAVRLSSHPVARALAQAVGEPITASSANISGRPAVVSAAELDKE
ncbi:MAG: L-threonylcarbamoyladenylate synthase, partial [Bilophila sp.]